uniref:Uncharacterized protein n=1 Tax=Daphnia galeata TaxID=27404 RepID=A0A8J2RK09_9CRUS|nr:unnamed protein product [Daphnia galeata]
MRKTNPLTPSSFTCSSPTHPKSSRWIENHQTNYTVLLKRRRGDVLHIRNTKEEEKNIFSAHLFSLTEETCDNTPDRGVECVKNPCDWICSMINDRQSEIVVCFVVNFGGGIVSYGARNVHANELHPMLAVSFQSTEEDET